jgi:hypothetical protein
MPLSCEARDLQAIQDVVAVTCLDAIGQVIVQERAPVQPIRALGQEKRSEREDHSKRGRHRTDHEMPKAVLMLVRRCGESLRGRVRRDR